MTVEERIEQYRKKCDDGRTNFGEANNPHNFDWTKEDEERIVLENKEYFKMKKEGNIVALFEDYLRKDGINSGKYDF